MALIKAVLPPDVLEEIRASKEDGEEDVEVIEGAITSWLPTAKIAFEPHTSEVSIDIEDIVLVKMLILSALDEDGGLPPGTNGGGAI
jgi:hypothetical protein